MKPLGNETSPVEVKAQFDYLKNVRAILINIIDSDNLVLNEHLALLRLRHGQVCPPLQNVGTAVLLDDHAAHRLRNRC